MKNQFILLVFIVLEILVCSHLRGDEAVPSATPNVAASPSAYETTLSKSAALIEQSRKNQEESHAHAMAATAKAEELIKRQEADLKQQEDNLARFDKILTVWERQQAQYQKYLDSLPSK